MSQQPHLTSACGEYEAAADAGAEARSDSLPVLSSLALAVRQKHGFCHVLTKELWLSALRFGFNTRNGFAQELLPPIVQPEVCSGITCKRSNDLIQTNGRGTHG
jgi:hypothetical protein